MSNPFEDDMKNEECDEEKRNINVIESIRRNPLDSFEHTLLEKLKSSHTYEERKELINFLVTKLQTINKQTSDGEKILVQKAVLILYIINLKIKQYLDYICEERKENVTPLDELEKFINNSQVMSIIEDNKLVVMRMMENNACLEGKLMLAKKLQDKEIIIDTLIRMESYAYAFEYLKENYEFIIFRKYLNYFIENIPDILVESLCNEPIFRSLPSAIVQKIVYDLAGKSKSRNCAFTYLNWEIKKESSNKEINNLWLALTVQDDPSLIYEFLEKKINNSFSNAKIDLLFALSVVNNNKNLYKCQSLLYCQLGLWDKAVDISLKANDFEYAKICAIKMVEAGRDDPIDELKKQQELFNETQKIMYGKPSIADQSRVWMLLTSYVLEHEEQSEAIKICLSFIKDSNGVLKFEEILSLFPSISSISDIKEPLKDCLNYYREKQKEINNGIIKTEIGNEEISKYLNKLKNRPIIVRPGDKCLRCKERAIGKPFYVFNCKHIFHDICLEELISQEFINNEINDNSSDIKNNPSNSSIIQSCPLCGLNVIENITKPFFTPENYIEELNSW
uniref:RING-type domain-containing protein n=1 Tax=Parastrongyloides trichosuri TaxID=131310 RepID=A0A0N4Z2Q5_PARTI